MNSLNLRLHFTSFHGKLTQLYLNNEGLIDLNCGLIYAEKKQKTSHELYKFYMHFYVYILHEKHKNSDLKCVN